MAIEASPGEIEQVNEEQWQPGWSMIGFLLGALALGLTLYAIKRQEEKCLISPK